MVGYGAGAYIMTLLDRAGCYEHTDCGDMDLGQYPDAGPVRDAAAAAAATADGIDGARTGVACACNGGQGAPGNRLVFAIVRSACCAAVRSGRRAMAVELRGSASSSPACARCTTCRSRSSRARCSGSSARTAPASRR